MNHSSRSVVTATRKRKDRGGIEDSSFYSHKGSFVNKHQQYHQPHINNNKTSSLLTSTSYYNNNHNNSSINTASLAGSSRLGTEPGLGSSNQVLAGYMAYEFLSKGTLFGQKFDPARAEAVPVSAAEPKRRMSASAAASEAVVVKPNGRSYGEVAQLLKGDGGAHIPGIVNPTQLARWIQM